MAIERPDDLKPRPDGTARFTVLDVGGTTLRIGGYDPATGALSGVRRVPVEGLARYPQETVPALQGRVVEQIVAELLAHRSAQAVGVSFAGPIAAEGRVMAAPTVWGRAGDPLPLQCLLEERIGVPVVVVNDVSAAIWRYVDTLSDAFCLVTVSSGIGNKVFRNGEILLDAEGHGGEIGHWCCDPSADAALCDCGGRGHLGAIASGRGVLAAAHRAARNQPKAFAASPLAVLAEGGQPQFDNVALAAAIRAGDPFATAVLRGGLAYLAMAIAALFTAIGIRRHVIIGGFALAVGPRYIELLGDELERLGCFGLSVGEPRGMVSLGYSDDDHALIGVGRLLSRRFSPACKTCAS